MSFGLAAAVAAMASVVVASNVLVQFLLGPWLTWGAFTYPLAFLVNDLTNRIHGPAAARRVVLAGFAVGLLCSAIGTQIEGAFGPLVTTRVAAASAAAFLVAQTLDLAIFDRLRGAGPWWRAPLVSSLLAGTVDTILFFAIAFSAGFAFVDPGVDVAWANEPVPLLGLGPVAPLWASLAVADFAVKQAVALAALAPFRTLSRRFAPR